MRFIIGINVFFWVASLIQGIFFPINIHFIKVTKSKHSFPSAFNFNLQVLVYL